MKTYSNSLSSILLYMLFKQQLINSGLLLVNNIKIFCVLFAHKEEEFKNGLDLLF